MGFIQAAILTELINVAGVKIDAETIHEDTGTLLFGLEAVGGKLFLTKDALLFYSHGINVSSRRKFTVIKLDDVIKAKSGFVANINVETKDKTYKFGMGMFSKRKWIDLINKQVEIYKQQ